MKKLILRIRYKLACWHRRRFQKLMAKCLGATRYYLRAKTSLSSLYGLQVSDLESFKKAYESGETHADMSSAYPRVFKSQAYPNIYADTDSVR